MNYDDEIAVNEDTQEGPPTYDLLDVRQVNLAVRGGVQYPRPTRDQQINSGVQRLERQVEDASWVRVHMTVGDSSRTDVGAFNAAHGNAGLAELLRQVADRLDS